MTVDADLIKTERQQRCHACSSSTAIAVFENRQQTVKTDFTVVLQTVLQTRVIK